MVYMNLEKKEFSEEKIKEYHKEAISEIGDDGGKSSLLCVDNADVVVIDEIEDGEIHAHSESRFGYVSFDIKLDSDDMIELIEQIVKKMNKFKTLLESLK